MSAGNHRSRVRATAGLAVVVGVIAFIASRSGESGAPAPAVDPTDGHAHGARGTTLGTTPGLTSGAMASSSATGRWQLHYALDFVGPDPSGAERSARLVLDAILELAPTADGWQAGRLSGAVVAVDPALVAQLGLDAGDVARDFERAFMSRLDGAHAIAEQRFAPGTPSGVQNLVATLTAGLQVVARPADARAWTADETGPDGPYVARYTADATRIDKTWHREEGRAPSDPSAAAPVVADGHVVLEHDARGGLARADYRLALRADLSLQEAVALRYRADVVATLRAIDGGDADWASALSAGAFVPRAPLDAPASAQTARPAPTESTATRPAAMVLADSRAAHDRGDWRARRAAMHELTEVMREDDGAVDEVVAMLSGTLEARADVRTMIEALASAGTERARRSLVKLLGDGSVPSEHRRLVATAVGFVRDADPELIDQLRETSLTAGDDPVGSAALYALAAQARVGGELGEGLGLELADELLGRAPAVLDPEIAGAAASDLAIMAWLDTVGALGGADVWPLVEPYLDHPTHRIRRVAVEALRFATTPAARVRLAEIMASHPDQWTRRAAIEAARYQPQAAFEAPVVRAFETDPDRVVRLAAAQTLAVWGYDAPRLYALIAAAAERETDATVKRMYQELLPRQGEVDQERPISAPDGLPNGEPPPKAPAREDRR